MKPLKGRSSATTLPNKLKQKALSGKIKSIGQIVDAIGRLSRTQMVSLMDEEGYESLYQKLSVMFFYESTEALLKIYLHSHHGVSWGLLICIRVSA